jgi:charged multivesicular body protein 2A
MKTNRAQTVRSNEQMMQSMKGATSTHPLPLAFQTSLTRTALLGSMNRQMNLPALQRIAMEFEKENDIMDQRQEMMDDAIDDATGMEDEEESEDVVNQVLDEIGIDLGQAVRPTCLLRRQSLTPDSLARHPVACKRRRCLRAKWHRRLAGLIPTTMTCRRA